MASRLLVCLWVVASSVSAVLAQSASPHAVTPLLNAKFILDEDVSCLSDALETGDPEKGPSTFALKARPGCLVPWHYHTAQEQLIVVQGTILTEMQGMRPASLGPGGFAFMQSQEKHQFTCAGAGECLLFVMFDRSYDIHWVTPMAARSAEEALSARVDEVVAEQMREQKIPGASVAVIRDGRVLKATGYGLANVELNVPVTPQSIFQTGSIGKQLTATAVMMLVEAGKVGLDDKLSKYFPEESAAWKDITIRHLLTHTSGIPDIFGESEKDTYTKGILDFRRDYSEDEIVKRFLALPLDFQPGERFNYSNTGYMLLGPLIERVTGEPWAEFLQERIFRPLGMTSTRLMSEEDIIPNRCSGYRLIAGKLQNQEWIPTSLNATSDGGHYTTVLDLAKWDAALYGESLLKKSSLEQMWSPMKLNSGELFPYGFGWEIADANGHRVLYHTGGNQGFYVSISRYVDDRLTIVVMNNLDEIAADTLRMAGSVAAVYLPAVKGAAPVKEWWLCPLCAVTKEGTQRCRPPG
jgi:CubicO group peptidase (beta-lactamase class C family)